MSTTTQNWPTQMLNYYLKLYIVNPHLFGSREVIEQNFFSGFPSKEYLHYESVLLLNLCDHRHQRLYRVALGMCSESLSFLLQNGIFYKYSEIQEMITNGEFQKITGGATSVNLGHIFRIWALFLKADLADQRYLWIQPESSKTINTPIVTMEDAIGRDDPEQANYTHKTKRLET